MEIFWLFKCLFLFFWLHSIWDLSSLTRIEPAPSALGAWSLNQWTTREVPGWGSFCWARSKRAERLLSSRQKVNLFNLVFIQQSLCGSAEKLSVRLWFQILDFWVKYKQQSVCSVEIVFQQLKFSRIQRQFRAVGDYLPRDSFQCQKKTMNEGFTTEERFLLQATLMNL